MKSIQQKVKIFISRVFVSAIAGIGAWAILSIVTTIIFCILFDMHPSAEDYEKHWMLLSVLCDGFILVGIAVYLLMFAKLCDSELE